MVWRKVATTSGTLAKTSYTLATTTISLAIPMGLENDWSKEYQWQDRFTLYPPFKLKYSVCGCSKWRSMENNEWRIELVLPMDNGRFYGHWWYCYLSKFSYYTICCHRRRHTGLGTFLSRSRHL